MVKVEPICAACLIHRGVEEAELATRENLVKMEVVRKLVELLREKFTAEAVPAKLGTERDRVVRTVTGSLDPYRELKRLSNEEALKILPTARKKIEESAPGVEAFKTACLIATAANAFEFGVLGYKFSVEEAGKLLQEARLTINDTEEAYNYVKPKNKVLYLADNAGEIGFDSLLIEVLKNNNVEVRLVVKGAPILNDALVEDAVFFNLDKLVDEVLTTPSDEVGLDPSTMTEALRRAYFDSDLVIAKGMGHYETLTEHKATVPTLHLLKAKCKPIAKSLDVEVGSLVAKLRRS
ncbi:MAG: ARMT1-like domain-containing protein [Candidatus Nezhaarchaeota archaeon]|nr:ARMT1-like domain-containing protein [Candidatus Nezhaarchaeota archaeon]